MTLSLDPRTADAAQRTLALIAPNAARMKRAYNRHLGRALVVAVNLHLLAAAAYWTAAYVTHTPPAVAETPLTQYRPVIDVEPLLAPEPAEPTGGSTPAPTPGVGVPTPVPDTEADPDATVATQDQIAISTSGPVGSTPNAGGDGAPGESGAGPSEAFVPPGPGGPTTRPPVRDPVEQTPEPEPVAETLTFAEVQPELIGGVERLQAGIDYPRFERDAGIAGQVVVQFVVSETGVPSNAVVVRSVSPGLDRAALDAVVRARFEPGRQNGRAVRVRFTLPVTFRLR